MNKSPIFEKLKIYSDSLETPQNSVWNEFPHQSGTLLSADFFPNALAETELPEKEVSMFENLNQTKLTPSQLNGYSKIQELKLVKIGLASSEKIVEWAEKILPNGKIFGEVLNANTLHYKTFKPHKGGLFCERIFGPLKDFECACGKKQKPFNDDGYVQNILNTKQSKRVFCPECDVEYTWSVIRRYQLGYIKLVSPVSHLWYLRTNPSYLSLLLDIRKRELESIIYCMQITTLEYYWRPLHALQINLTPATLLQSYKKYLQASSQKLNHENSVLTRKLKKKQKKELEKRQNFQIPRYSRASATAATLQAIKSLDSESLETKIQFLEKSYQLSSENYSSRLWMKTSNVKDFLNQKLSKKLKKTTFSLVYKKINLRIYEEIYFWISRRSFMSLVEKKTNSLFYDSVKPDNKIKPSVKLENFSNIKKPASMLKLVLKNYLCFSQKKSKKFRVSNINQAQKNQTSRLSLSILPIWQSNSIYFLRKQPSHRGNSHSINSNNSSEPILHTNFLNYFLILVRKCEIHQTWQSIFTHKKSSMDFIFRLAKIPDRKWMLMNFEPLFLAQTFETLFFLYVLVLIQENRDVSLNTIPPNFLKEKLIKQMMMSLPFNSLTESSFWKNQQSFTPDLNLMSQFDFLSNLLQTNLLLEQDTETVKIIEIETFLKNPHNNFVQYLNILLNKLTNLLNKMVYSSYRYKYWRTNQKEYKIFLSSELLKKGKPLPSEFNPALYSKEYFVTNFLQKKNKLNVNYFLFKKLSHDKKIDQFTRFQHNYATDYSVYIKNKISLTKKLSGFKQRSKPSSFNLFNNIYTVAFSKGWQTEKEWRYFLYYNTAPIEMQDHRLFCYKHRFVSDSFLDSSFSNTIPILGANLIQKLVFQYEGFELKKMAKQHQNLLPKLNRYIRHLKQIAQKKSDFLYIQKLLQKRDQIIRRLKLLRKLFKKNVKPSATLLNTLPVLPPDLRPILKMQNQIAASDLNRFYQRILYRNERLKKFLRANASMLNYEPGFELKYAQRLLQEAVDNLIQNGKGNVKPETNSRGQPLKSLSEILKGKQGRFRQYLLGKRVDYSGRSVIVVGPTLKIYQCGLPFEMAIELFLPFLIKRIFQYKLARTVIGAKTILKTQKKTTWNLLEEIMKNHPILLNRAPTLHRLGIQAFQPKLIEGRAILLHPLVCPAFNADFDGDQMAVHVPITVEARTEAWKLMFSRNHLISPATGEPMLLPSQDMVLGCFYLTTESFQIQRFHNGRPFSSGTRFYFSNMQQVLQAYQQQKIHLQTPIWLKWNGLIEMEPHFSQPLEIRLDLEGSWTELRPKIQKRLTPDGFCQSCYVRTTAGRILFNNIIENCVQN